MDNGFGFSDDFFNDGDFPAEEDSSSTQAEAEEAAAAALESMPPLPDSKGGGLEIMLLYDDGGLKDNLRRCMTQAEYTIYEASDLVTAREVLKEHPRLGIIVSNSTVAGDDAASILRSLVSLNPDLICIICTDIIDFLSFTALINTAPVYKILTFPLDIDRELIPAIGEIASSYLVRQVHRDEWDNLSMENEDLAGRLSDALHYNRIRQGLVRRMYNGMAEVLAKSTAERCNDAFGNTIKNVSAFQKKILDRYFLSLSSADTPLEQHLRSLRDVFHNEAEGRIIQITVNDGPPGGPALRNRIAFIMWLLFYRLYLSGKTYSGKATINIKADKVAFVDVTYNIDYKKWDELHSNSLQKSYTSTIDGIVEYLCSGFHINESPVTRFYETTISLEKE